MKATLEFTLPEEHTEFNTACHAQKLLSALFEIDQYIHNKAKYATSDVRVYEVVRADIAGILADNGVEDIVYD